MLCTRIVNTYEFCEREHHCFLFCFIYSSLIEIFDWVIPVAYRFLLAQRDGIGVDFLRTFLSDVINFSNEHIAYILMHMIAVENCPIVR
jgi:hypothetical protein